MKARDIIIGFVVLVVLITGALLIRRARTNTNKNVPIPTPSFGQSVEDKFPGLTIPSNADRTALSGAQGSGEAFRTFQNGKFSLTIMATLPTGNYSASIVDGSGASIFLGNLVLGKGGYLINFTSSQDLTSYKNIRVTTGTTAVLQGSF